MRRLISPFLILATSVMLTAQQPAPSRLGVSEPIARDNVLSAMMGFTTPSAGAKAFLALTPSMRVTIVNEIVAWAKTYYRSAAFKTTWAAKRESQKPEALDLPPAGGELQQMDAEQKKQIDQMRASLAQMPKEMQASMEAAIKDMEKTFAEMRNDPTIRKLQEDGFKAQRAEKVKAHEDEVAKWEQDYPANPDLAVARRLRQFLSVTADVNFDAALVQKMPSRVQVFSDPRYEAKPNEWKMCFRAGRDACTAARTAAQTWLNELK